MKILVAEDEADLRALVAEFLTARGADVVESADGAGVLRHLTRSRLRACDFDAVVLDVALPRLGGIAALRKIRESNPRLPVIVITGRLEPSLHRQARGLGARAVLTKPVKLDQLWSVIVGGEGPMETGERPVTAPQSARVLIVDDEREMREAIAEFLDLRGHRTATASDAASAMRMLTAEPADVVLLDMNMPGLSGVDALPAIRAIAPGVAVIMVTGNTDREQAKRAAVHGAFDYLVKPINWEHFAETLAMALAAKAGPR